MKPVIIIPAYNPGQHLIGLALRLRELNGEIPLMVINDGSDETCRAVFQELKKITGCTVYSHTQNAGKGAALKTGIRNMLRQYPGHTGCVTADADGQHDPEDILRIAGALEHAPRILVLGCREFAGTEVPRKSRWGNAVTSRVFRLCTGVRCADTQTGLRGLPENFARRCLGIAGDRYEFEMEMLLQATKEGVQIMQLPIKTIYMEQNSGSHFKPVRDSLRIYAQIFKFSVVSLLSFLVDISLFTILSMFFFPPTAAGILSSNVMARCLSGITNFTLNKVWVFRSGNPAGRESGGYLLLFLAQMAASSLLISLLSGPAINLTLLKILVDSGLFCISYLVQKHIIFRLGQVK